VSDSSAPARAGRLAGYPWLWAAAVLAISLATYFLLPLLAPTEFAGLGALLLLGIVNGLAVGVALRLPHPLTPPLAVGAVVGTVIRFSLDHQPEPFVVVMALIIGGEILAMVYLLRRRQAWRLRETGDLLRYGLTVLGVAVVAGGMATAAVALHGHLEVDSLSQAWTSWVIDDLFGLIVITPAIATIGRPSSWSWLRSVEYLIAMAFTAVTTYYIFFVVVPGEQGLLGWPYIVVLGSIWIAVRLGVQAAAPVVAVQFWLAVVGTVAGLGAFAGASADPLDRLLAVELFSISMAAVILALGVLRDARHRAADQLEAANRFFRDVVNGSEAAIYAKAYDGNGPDGRYVLANEASHRITGRDAAEIMGRTDADLLPPEVAEPLRESDRRVMSSGQPLLTEQRFAWPDGSVHIYSSSSFPLDDHEGRVWGVAGVATDITELIQSREEFVRQGELLHAVFEMSPTPAIRLTMEEGEGIQVRAANAAMCSLLGARPGEFADCDLMDHIVPADAATALDVLEFARHDAARVGGPSTRQRELRMRTEDGRVVWVLMSAAAVRGHEDLSPEIVAQFEDFTARREAELALSDQAMRDAVTGLPNRRALHERVDAALQRLRRHPGIVTVLFCDLDHFKDVNDSLGHHVGDRLLVEVADRLRSALRPEDTIARLGGDEFVALGEGITEPGDAVLMALRLQDKLSAPWVHEDQVFRPAMSIGIAMTTDAEVTVDELLRRADLAMYRAKEQGRNRVEIYERSVDDEVQHAVNIQHELRRAIDTGGLVLHYQPIVDLADQRLVGAEALVRMRGQDGQLLSPGEFVPQAEATGLIVPLGAWVVQQALVDLVRLHEVNHDITLSINVSPTQLREDGFSDYLLEQIAFAGVRVDCVSIEVTETALIHDPVRSGRELTRLSEAGIRISLDDFGTGYSSLSWLTQFPVDIVKIDKSFTDDVGIDERKTAIISAVIAVSHELGFTVVAEGVESDEQGRRLLDLGCDRGQGYFYGRPTPIEEAPWTHLINRST
jgi:diguanylate cyclase (GGDEF)-like protein/PAS domain S-box-containing protein